MVNTYIATTRCYELIYCVLLPRITISTPAMVAEAVRVTIGLCGWMNINIIMDRLWITGATAALLLSN